MVEAQCKEIGQQIFNHYKQLSIEENSERAWGGIGDYNLRWQS